MAIIIIIYENDARVFFYAPQAQKAFSRFEPEGRKKNPSRGFFYAPQAQTVKMHFEPEGRKKPPSR